ncbi:MAG TPA: FtsQ-type POTRA domain-containing protein [Pyrinomonadaceae bacterium]
MASRKPNTGARTTKERVKVNRRPAKARRSPGPPSRTRTFVLPLFLSVCILVCLGALGFLGYQTVTASDFFDVAKIEVRGIDRASESDIRRVVEMQTERSGVWNADLPAIKEKLEKLTFVRSAAVSRVLPNGIRVNVFERVPQAIVRTNQGNMLVDADGAIIAPAREKEPSLPFAMTGWNEGKSEAAAKENLERLRMYQRMLTEWQEFNLSSRVLVVNMEDTREPRAIVEDSGTVVSIALVRDRFGESLKRGINAIVGKGEMFEAVNLVGQNMILAPRKTK